MQWKSIQGYNEVECGAALYCMQITDIMSMYCRNTEYRDSGRGTPHDCVQLLLQQVWLVDGHHRQHGVRSTVDSPQQSNVLPLKRKGKSSLGYNVLCENTDLRTRHICGREQGERG